MSENTRFPVYVVAVSGGIDSMVLIDMIRRLPGRQLVIAHFDHGIRAESASDEAFVREYAETNHIPYVTEKEDLGARASEEAARRARYAFLHRVREKTGARAIMTAHHQDDVLETMCINMLRGTGWRGLASLRSHEGLLRPLLKFSKADIVHYAIEHGLEWCEDLTNEDPRYLRNWVRQLIIPRLDAPKRLRLIELYEQQLSLVGTIEQETSKVLECCMTQEGISRYWLIMMPPEVSYEVLQRAIGRRLERPSMERLLLFAKTAMPYKKTTVEDGVQATVTADRLIVSPPET